ncbi:MAG: isoprenylcysteine carboxylmethyltransferase family protein [Gemmatimonadota bacterium]|nr:isoprenylcysteine carboxylmethyltransferase family protein [Gemmatimonadota bacterium]MDH3478811.1 isoprenylcysteine carboxylmethyltransferase family protein [Gemmatimonadota bacterium]MDH3571795.1 isoprenylcysteine carboxylmethyltransferase family protein [Gemmatimonadota bacterium]MDH5550066.1 isoprenylcysteine carboxylmethyltransferase family protein [Gemmatimonadota bacterium]
MTTLLLALRAALYMSGFVFLWGWLAVTLRPWDPALGGPLPAWPQVAGAVVAVGGAALALVCGGYFVARGRGTPAPFDAPREFVATGPYRWVRNPMYVGGLALLAGAALWLRSPAMLLLAAAAGVLVHLFVLFYEEPTLRRLFGTTYEAYTRRVHRWLPRPPRDTAAGGG